MSTPFPVLVYIAWQAGKLVTIVNRMSIIWYVINEVIVDNAGSKTQCLTVFGSYRTQF